MCGITGALEAGKIAKQAYTANKDGKLPEWWQDQKDSFHSDVADKKASLGNGGWKEAGTYKGFFNDFELKSMKDSIPIDDLEKLAQTSDKGAAASKSYKMALNAIKLAEATTNPEAKKEATRIASKALALANASAHGQIAATGFFGKTAAFLGKWSGYSKAGGAMKNFATKSPIAAKMMNLGKGSGPFLAISGVVALATQVVPTFLELGPVKGIKQLFKSSAKTVASAGGWAAGAAVGAAVGSVVPGAGTVIGAAVGALCGIVGGFGGSYVASKAADAVVGKDELEIAEGDKTKEATKQIMQNPDQIDSLIQATAQKINENGGASQDDKIALESLKKIAAARQNAQMSQMGNAQYPMDQFNQPSAYSNYNFIG